MLEQRFAADRFTFTNAGVNGDLAYNALQRLDSVIRLRPDVVTVLLGTNDANASLTERNVRMFTRMKTLPTRPTIDWFRESLTAIVDRLTTETSHAGDPLPRRPNTVLPRRDAALIAEFLTTDDRT